MVTNKHILMLAAENDALPAAKVGGVGDVVRDVPRALADHLGAQCRVSIVIPSHGFLHKLPGARRVEDFHFQFGGHAHQAVIYELAAKTSFRHSRVRHFVIHHESFESRDPNTKEPRIYCDDPPNRPFATDSTKFASFCAAAGAAILHSRFGAVDRLHLHDWHSAFLLILAKYDPKYKDLQSIRTIFTIHNLALQGIRPFRGDASSLEAWYPGLNYDENELSDPDYADCLNPMAIGIRQSDAVHVVSPSYANEIRKPSLPSRNHPKCYYYGGEGLEVDLIQAAKDRRLFGILNGCEYASLSVSDRDEGTWGELLHTLRREILQWGEHGVTAYHLWPLHRLDSLLKEPHRPKMLLTSVTRIVDQKVKLMCPLEQVEDSEGNASPALERILEHLDEETTYILLGTGDARYEKFFLNLSYRFESFIFLRGYSENCAAALYEHGDLFLMPSSFEPCGISQMLAMQKGQPCVVHSVGGLNDTIEHGATGFSFSGATEQLQAGNFVSTTLDAVRMGTDQPERYASIARAAAGKRFLWSETVREYASKLYRFDS